MIIKSYAEGMKLKKEAERLEQIAFDRILTEWENGERDTLDLGDTEEWARISEINNAIDEFIKNNQYVVWNVRTGHRIEYFPTEESAKKFAEQNPHYEVTTNINY